MNNRRIVLSTNSAKHLHLDDGKLKIERFPDGEICLVLKKNLKNKDVIVIGSTQPPADNLLELVLLIGAVLQKGAKKVTVLIPYFGYARSDKENEVVNVKTIVKILEKAGEGKCNFIILEPHCDNINDYFDTHLERLSAIDLIAESFPAKNNLTVVAPDRGSRKDVKRFAHKVNSKNIVTIEKKRLENAKVKLVSVDGTITSTVIIVDDMISSGNTILETAKMLKFMGAKKIYVAVTHMVYPAGGWKKLAKSKLIDRVYLTNSIQSPMRLPNKFDLINISGFLEQKINLC